MNLSYGLSVFGLWKIKPNLSFFLLIFAPYIKVFQIFYIIVVVKAIKKYQT